MPLAIELNSILGAKYVVLASAGRVKDLDGWKTVAETLNRGAQGMKAGGLKVGYHNHQLEFTPVDGKRPMEVLAANTSSDVMLQLDVGTCVEMKSDPVEWINQNPGRIRSLHLKEWSPDTGYKASAWRGRGTLGEDSRCGREDGRSRVCVDRTGGQPVHPVRVRGALPAGVSEAGPRVEALSRISLRT